MKIKKNKYIIYHLPWQLYIVVIFVISSIPGNRFPEIQFNMADKVVHFFIFGLLGLLVARSMGVCQNTFCRKNYVMVSIIIGISYALIDEWHQSYIPGRYSSISDWVADGLGIIVFVLLFWRWNRRKLRDRENKQST
jgi:VanZ family protein